MANEKQYCKKTFYNLPEEKRERILRVITEEFANNGFQNTSISQIAKKSGISVGSVYKYFDSKEEMFSLVVKEGLDELKSVLESLSDSDVDIALKAEEIIRTLISFSRERPELIKLYCALTADGSFELLTEFSQAIEALSSEIYIKETERAQSTGDVRSDVDPRFFAFLLDSVFMMLQFSTACEYYKKRFSIYMGKPEAECDELIVSQTMKFLKAAFNFK